MPDNAAPKVMAAAPGGGNSGSKKRGAYQDRDKPAQIRFSNISAGKGEPAIGRVVGECMERTRDCSRAVCGHCIEKG